MSIKICEEDKKFYNGGQGHTCKSKEEFYKLLGLNSKGEYSKGNYKKTTRQGYPVKNTFKSKDGRKYIVGQRSNDYFVANGYNVEDGTWSQGYYGFSTRAKAINFAKKNAYRKYK